MKVQVELAILCIIAIMLFAFFVFYHSPHLLSWLSSWLFSNHEEKVGLTKLNGVYNANGYLVHSDSDILLDTTGSFKRFDSVDRDVKMTIATTSLSGAEWSSLKDDEQIPPQPLRPAPVPDTTTQQKERQIITRKQLSNDEQHTIEKTSISPIPRPVSSINVATLTSQSTFPVCLSPPPSPSTASLILSAQQPQNNTPPSSPSIVSIAPLMNSFVKSNQVAGLNQTATKSTEQTLTNGGAEEPDPLPLALKRAMSCDSICSDTSVALGDLEDVNITGYLCIGLEFDSECSDLIVNVLEAKDLQDTSRLEDLIDSYVRVSLLPDTEATIQTRIYRCTHSPSYKERFLFALNPREQNQRTLSFHLYTTDTHTHTLLGEGEIRLCDISLRQPVTTWVTLTDTGQKGTEFGELMFSLSYLPTAERLTVVVVKARNLKFQNQDHGDSFVKVYLMQHGKKINKKKTSTKKNEKSPIFNEAMIFSVPSHTLSTIQLRLTVAETPIDEKSKAYAIGHVIIGTQASGRSLSHWNQMLTALRKPVAMWHNLRK